MTVNNATAAPTGIGYWSGPGAASSGPSKGTSLTQFIEGLAASSFLGLDGDLSFVVLAEQIKSQDAAIAKQLKDINGIAKAREVLSKDIDQLREVLNDARRFIKQKDSGHDDDTHIAWSDLAKTNLGDTYTEAQFWEEHTALRQKLEKHEYYLDANGELQTAESSGYIGDKDHKFSVNDLDKEIKSLESKIQQLDSNRDIGFAMLNSAIAKKGNLLELLSNMDKKKHDTQKSIIGNLR